MRGGATLLLQSQRVLARLRVWLHLGRGLCARNIAHRGSCQGLEVNGGEGGIAVWVCDMEAHRCCRDWVVRFWQSERRLLRRFNRLALQAQRATMQWAPGFAEVNGGECEGPVSMIVLHLGSTCTWRFHRALARVSRSTVQSPSKPRRRRSTVCVQEQECRGEWLKRRGDFCWCAMSSLGHRDFMWRRVVLRCCRWRRAPAVCVLVHGDASLRWVGRP